MIGTAAEIAFWLSFALILYSYAGYPILIAFVSRFFAGPSRDLSHEPTVTMLIAAYNEESSIEGKIRDTLALEYPPEKLDIVVVSDGSTDGTNVILERLREEVKPRLRVITKPRGGKTVALNTGVSQCTGDIVVFSDVTSQFEPRAIRELVSYYADPRVGGVTGICRFHHPKGAEGGSGVGQILYGGYEQTIRVFQSRIRTTTSAAGPIHSVRRALFIPLSADACFDMMEPIALVRNGYRVACAPGANAHEVATRSSHQEYRMRVRVAAHGFVGLMEAIDLMAFRRGPWIALQIVSHKLLRYLVPFFLLTLFVSNAVMIPYFWWAPYIFVAQTVFYATAGIAALLPARGRSKLLNLPLYFCIGNSAALVSLCDVLRGQKHVTWKTERG